MGLLKNEVGRPSNETLKTRRILKGLIFVVILVICYLGGYMLGSNLGDNTDKKETNTNKEELSINDNEVVKLFNRMNSGVFTSEYGLLKPSGFSYNGYFYSKDKVTIDDVDDYMKFAASMKELYGNLDLKEEDINVKKYDANTIDEKSIKIFESAIQNKNSLFYYNGKQFKYSDGNYVYKGGAGLGGANATDIYTKRISAYKEGNKIIITNKMMVVYSGPSENENYDYKYIIYKNIGENAQTFNKIAEFEQKEEKEIKIEDYMDKLDTYKWTFTKNNDGNYIFTSVEKVK